MKKENTAQKIQNAMRRNEQEVLNHLRRSLKDGDPVTHLTFFGTSWLNALERLQAAKKIKYIRGKWTGHYAAVRGARPVTRKAI